MGSAGMQGLVLRRLHIARFCWAWAWSPFRSIRVTVIAAGGVSARSVPRAGWLPVQARRRRPRGLLRQPRRGGPLLADCCVSRRSLCVSMAPSSILALAKIGSVPVIQIGRRRI